MELYLYEDLYQLERSHFWHIAKRQTVLAVLRRFLPGGEKKILDYGCGTGENIKALASLGQVSGADISPEAINFCQRRGVRAVLVKDEKLPFPDHSFNLVTMLDVLEHIDEESPLKEVNRVLAETGWLLITVPAYSWAWSKWDEVLHHKRRYSLNQLKKVLDQSGFEVVKGSYMFSFLLVPALLTRLLKTLIFKGYYPSDFKMSNPLINRTMLILAKIERWSVLNTGVQFGTSIICLAKKR